MSTRDPYYRKTVPSKKFDENTFNGGHVDFCQSNWPVTPCRSDAHLAAFNQANAVATANAQFDNRVAAVLRAYSGLSEWNGGKDVPSLRGAQLLEETDYGAIVDFEGELFQVRNPSK
jgi:hypothetical protein